jgi:uncharacterized protein (TIRG00374 family)
MKFLKIAVTAVSFAILAALIAYADPAKLVPILSNARLEIIAGALGLSVISMMLRVAKWKALLGKASFGALLPIQMLGMTISNFTPGKMGEPAKSLILKLRSGIDVSQSFPSIIWERVVDVLVLVVLAATAFAFLPLTGNLLILGALGMAAFLGLAMLALLVLHSKKVGLRLFGFARKFPILRNISEDFVKTFYEVRQGKKALVACLVLTAAAWLLDGVVFWLSFLAIGIQLDVALFPGILALATAVGIASSLPGGLGSSEVVLAALLGLLGVEAVFAVTGVLLARFLTFWFVTAVGGISMAYLGRKIDLRSALGGKA